MKKSICCKLLTTPAFEVALKETSEAFANACNFALEVALKENTSNAIKLHHLCYDDIRKQFELSANLAIRAIRRVVSCMTKLKGKRKVPKKFLPKSIDYDARIFAYRPENESVSITTMQGRLQIPLVLGDFQRQALKDQKPTAATVIQKGKVWYIHISIEKEPSPIDGDKIVGIDLGITNIATSSNGLKIEGASRQAFKNKCAKVRASLQSKGTKGAKKVLKRLSGKERRRIKHENHVISRQLVNDAKTHTCKIIRMERLKDIRTKTKTWNKHTNRMMAGWSFYELQKFVEYKAEEAGIKVEYINAAYTSQTCHTCLKLGSRLGERFVCLTCGEQHADVNASHVIALGGAPVNVRELAS